jgi:hypothetical protein
MIIKPTRPDWYCWLDPDPDWCRANGEMPGLQFENIRGRLAVNYHVSHVPCLPEAAVVDHNIVEQTRQQNLVLPYESSGLLRSYQAADLQRLKLRRGALLAYGMRVGKQQPVDACVLTPRAWVPIGDINVGDRVVGSDGRAVEVLGKFPQGVKPSYRVSFSDGSFVEAGPEHLWTVQYPVGGRVWRDLVLTTEQLRTRPVIDVVATTGQRHKLDLAGSRLRLPLLKAPIRSEGGSLPIPPYLLGQLIANGDIVSRRAARLVCNRLDWAEIKVSLVRENVTFGEARVYGGACRVGIRNMFHATQALGLRVHSRNKFLPTRCLFASVTDRLALLQGLLDGDGSISKSDNRISYSTVSEQLAYDVRALVESLGGIARVKAYDRTHEDKSIEYRVRLKLPPGLQAFRVSRKAERFKPGTHAIPRRYVESVEYVRDVESVCIAVDAVDALYVTERYILTHNSALACHLHNPNDGILLAVGPLAAREVWCDWIERTTGFPPWVLYGRKNAEAAPGYGAYFCHYDVLEAHTPFLVTQKIGTLVLDEVHLLQNASRRDNAVNACVFRASKILGLSGTPMFNKPISMYRLLHMLTPGAWGSRFNFAKFFCDAQPGAHGWLYEGQSNAEILAARLSAIMVRRTWQEVMPELPPTTRIIEPVDVTGAAYVALEAAAMKAALAAGNASQGGYLATLRHKLAEVKIKPAKQIAEQAAADGHKVVMWVWHVKIGDKVENAMSGDASRPVFRLQAGDSAPKRQAILDAFRAHEGPCYLVASMGVGGVALDLSASDYAIFVELDWTPANVRQAEFRTFHKDRPHVVVYLHADDPTETKLIEVLDLKNSFANAIGLGFDDVARKVLL